MTTVPLGHGAYKRLAAGVPEIRVENRWLEASPANLHEHVMLLSRPGTDALATFTSNPEYDGPPLRGNFFKAGLFSDALFVVSGNNFWRYDVGGTKTQITGSVGNNGKAVIAWQKGIGYERLFIADGLLLQFYAGPTPSSGTLTLSGDITDQVVQIGTTFYAWNVAVDTNAPDGTMAHPWLADPGTDPLQAFIDMLTFDGIPGVQFSSDLAGPNAEITPISGGEGPPVLTVVIDSVVTDGTGDTIATVVTGTGGVLSFGAATLENGGINALQGVAVPDGVGITSIAAVSGYILCGVANSQKFFWINPGEVTIDPLDFAEKESSPDNIVDMNTVGDQVLINGEGSSENWYATGNSAAPFAPVEGRVYQRGAVAGTPVQVQDAVFLVGDDLVVYEVGYLPGGQNAGGGVVRVSDHGIEERIRRQIRREQGLTP